MRFVVALLVIALVAAQDCGDLTVCDGGCCPAEAPVCCTGFGTCCPAGATCGPEGAACWSETTSERAYF
uniref:Granulin-like protein n=1 Tax=Pectinaria gouldii TaxID=260746 RepID=U6BG37_PECGU|nr:granulin-like protein [Pectinaria gouldii]